MMRKGSYFATRQAEHVILSVRDIEEEESNEREEILRTYYERRGRSAYADSPFRVIRQWLGMPIPIYFKGSAIDGVHPNEPGYDFWGRYLGKAIYEEWKAREDRAHATETSTSSADKKKN